MTEIAEAARARLPDAKRVVVKVGTRLLANRSGKPEPRRIRELVKSIAGLMKEGREVVLVSSGAIGMGISALGMKKRPSSLPDLQMAAAVGQTQLVSYYAELFAKHNIPVGQVLLTHDLLTHRVRHLNARNTLLNLLRNGILPIVNENDAVAVDEIRVGDNDSLGALTSLLVDADVLVLLTTVNGLRKPGSGSRTLRISYLERVTRKELKLAGGSDSEVSVGGMRTKLVAAQGVATSGGLTAIVDGRKPGALKKLFLGEDLGTLIGGGNGSEVRGGRKRWLAFFHRAAGTLEIDEGARKALEKRGTSLLPIGVTRVRGVFDQGALVNIEDSSGILVARGLVDYSSENIDQIKGCKSSEIKNLLGRRDYDEVIHRDNMVLLTTGIGE